MSSNQQNNKEKEVYFIILTPSEEKVNFDFKFSSENEPKSIYKKSIEISKDYFIEHNVFKMNIKKNEEKDIEEKEEEEAEDNDEKNYKIEYIVGVDAYEISFPITDNTFIYNAELKKGNKYLKRIVKEDINQKIIPLYNKLDIFLEALKKANEENKINILYDETIELYQKKKKFSLLITLFLKIYNKNKELCSKLLNTFKEINGKGNSDKDDELKVHLEKFNKIYSNAEDIIKSNNYDSINFYGILFCYLFHYDNDNFPKLLKEFSEGNAEILYEILIIYYSHFRNSLNQNSEFYNNFLSYAINQKKKSNIIERIINYTEDIETFLYIINENKANIIKIYDNFKKIPITLSSNLKLKKREYNKKKEIDFIRELILDIIDFSNNNEILIIYLTSEFWINLLKQYNKADMENINNCYRLREIYKKYYKLINNIYKETDDDNKKNIKKDINKYYFRDEFAFILDKNIKKFLENKGNKQNDQEKLGIVEEYNPYYSSEDKDDIERYKNNRETSIFNSIKFRNPTVAFKKSFIKLNFESMFKENIVDFLNKIISKIEDIETFGTVVELIIAERLENKKIYYYNLLKEKYELIIKNQIKSLKGEELNKAIKILSDFISRIYLEEDNNDFLKDKISKLDDKIKPLIYNELMKTYNDKKYEKMKQYIYDIFLNKLEDVDNIINLIESLSNDDQKQFLIELMKKCEFEKEEFYSNTENKKIKLLCYLNDKGKLDIKYNDKIEILLDDIRNDLESETGSITKKKLEEFLNLKQEDSQDEYEDKAKKEVDKKLEEKKDENDEKEKNKIIQKLSLIRLVLENYDPVKNYGDLKNIVKEINETIKDLNFIKNSIIIFHRKQYEMQIRQLNEIINEIEAEPIKEFKIQAKKDKRDALLGLKQISLDINNVKDFLLFKKIYEKSTGNNQEARYNEAKSKLDEIKNLLTQTSNKEELSTKMFQSNNDPLSNIEAIIFDKYKNIFTEIKDELSKKEDSFSDKFIKQMVENCGITNEETKKDLSMIIKSKKYELVVKSIKFFFENFGNKELTLPNNIELSTMRLYDLKIKLQNLKDDKIYDYESNSSFYKVFTSFYEKKEAMDFLLDKINTNIDYLKIKLDPTVKSISISDIEDAIQCLNQFRELKDKKSLKIIEYLKYLDEETIERFVRYSKHYPSIIELDRKNEKDIFEEVYTMIDNAKLIFDLDSEYFCYYFNGKESKEEKIKELIKLKNKINIQPESKHKKIDTKKNDLYKIKCEKLIFFKDIVSNFEAIYDKILILRKKGFNIPIKIIIFIKFPKIIYKFNENGEEKDFKQIINYLLTIKNDFENQLDITYQNSKYLRFLYGKLFRKIKLHQEGIFKESEISILRYILNKIDYDDKIIDGEPNNVKLGNDFETEYKLYTKDIFKHMSNYIISLFEKNQLNYKKHFENMLIKGDIKYKGIYIFKSKYLSMEQFILKLFLNKLDKMPIAQNILICSNETPIEELQSFFYRAILCDYNTLFAIEILESFSNFQHNKMYSYIDKLLSYKLENIGNKKINKCDTKEYLNSCICFIYQNLENENAFKNELEKYITSKSNKENMEKSFLEDNGNKENGETMEDLDISSILNISNNSFNFQTDNIKIFSSDVCGLGKSFQIKKEIKEKGEKYYHFPLGGKLTKNLIYEKISKLLKKLKTDAKIKKEEENKKIKNNQNDEEVKNDKEYLNYNNIAVHLDLIESEETSLINEFLFSFLFTKFYNCKENIIYIPNNIKIYVEIPNSFENYLTKYGILNEFKIENIELGKLPKLELEKDIIKNFQRIIGADTNEQIEEFIKKNIGIEKYTYHQVITFIKLFISQFSFFDSKIRFKNLKKDDITEKCISYFAKSTQYFTNGGFAKLIMEKNEKIKNKIDLCMDAYNNDLKFDKEEKDKKEKFRAPLIFIDKEKKKFKLELLPNLNGKENNYSKGINIANKEVDILYLIDATGSMDKEIKAAKTHVIHIFEELKNNYKDYKFQFGAVFYRDQIDSIGDKNEYFPLTEDMKDLKNNISKIVPDGGGDIPEDWVAGYKIALNDIKWRDGIKLIIHIADAGAHGVEYSKNDNYPDEGPKLTELIQNCAKNNINIIGFQIGEEPEKSFEKMWEIYYKYKLENEDHGQFMEIYDFNRGNDKENQEDIVSKNFHRLVIESANQVLNPSYKYLKKLKHILDLKNDVIKDEGDKKSLLSILDQDNINYVITDDNYKKMILLVYRIKANVPVIIMGETGCGKTSLITKLSQILNNGENVVEIINIHPGITEEEICKRMIDINKRAKEKIFLDKEKKIKKELWAFFDEINTCLSLSLLTEIFINRTFNGEKLEDNIRLIGACNPYRKRKLTAEKCGLTREDDKEDDLVYKVEQLPQSLLYYVFSFGSVNEQDEKKYIYSIINKVFNKDEEELHKLTTEAISKCHIILRDTFQDPSIVSLREIARFKNSVQFFNDYFKKKDETFKFKIEDKLIKCYKIKSIICSIYLCYYIRLISDVKRGDFDNKMQETLLKIVNVYSKEENDEEKENNLLDKIKNQQLKSELYGKNFNQFSDMLKIEEEFLIKQVELDKGIGETELLKENLFLLFLAVVTKIPVIIVGKPGTGKSLSAQLIYNSMKGEYSKNTFFRNYPPIIQIYFQGSESTKPENVTELFKKAENLYENYKKTHKKNDQIPIYMILFDELGLAEKSPSNPLKVLHSKLEYDGKKEGVCFIGISNYSLDAAKINRALSLSVPNLEEKLEQLKTTSKSIVKSISEDISKEPGKILIFNILSRAYQLYKYFLSFIKKLVVLKQYVNNGGEYRDKDLNEIERQDSYKKLIKEEENIKTEFHGNRDFYNIIKGVAIEGSKLNNITDENQIIPIIENYIERNFGGVTYEIDINFDLVTNDIKEDMNTLKNGILKEKIPIIRRKKKDINKEQEEVIKVPSVYLFKKIYNEACNLEKSADDEKITGSVYKIKDDHIDKYDLNKCINDNINDYNSRYLLLEIKSSLAPLIYKIIQIQNPDKNKDDIKFFNGSTFPDDDNNEYKIKKVGEIQANASSEEGKIIILQNLDLIQPYLYDLYNMNYKIIDEQKYVRICLDNFSEDLTPINETFRIIILVDQKFVDSVDMAFLNRLEKMQINFQDLLNIEQYNFIKKIKNEIRLAEEIKKHQSKIDYDLENLLINCNEEEIGGLVYYYSIENKKEKINENDIKDKIYSKISNLLPQDIITILQDDNPIKKKYFEEKKYYNLNAYINDLESARKNQSQDNYKISIIYTFSSSMNTIEGYDKTERIIISEIRTEDKLKNDIDDIKNKNENEKNKKHIILMNFEQYNSNKIQFIADYIEYYCKNDNYNYIFIIHIQRCFKIENKTKKEKTIYSIPNIYKNINQLFIDNLQGSDLTINDILNESVKNIMLKGRAFENLDNEFKDILIHFVYEEISKKKKNEEKSLNISMDINEKYDDKSILSEEKYSEELIKYMQNDLPFKDDIINKAKKLIELDQDSQGDCKSLINEIYKEHKINKNSIDFVTCILDYIIENIFKKYLLHIFRVLEDNNFLTTLMEINKDRNSKLDKNDMSAQNKKGNEIILAEMKTKFLEEIKVNNDAIYEPKFLLNYKIPGFYNFFKNLYDYLVKNITSLYFINEKKLRNYSDDNSKEAKKIFHENEKELLNKVVERINQDKLFDLLIKLTPDLILNDYITFSFYKYKNLFSTGLYGVIKLLLSLRFPDKIEIIKNNRFNIINIIILKIIWIESNKTYIENILKAFEISKDIVDDKDGMELIQKMRDVIYDTPINYIIDGERNQEHSREVNECFYLFLAGLCLSITENIRLMDTTIKNYFGRLKDINNVLQNLNHDLHIYLNELYIIDELLEIIEYEFDKGIDNINNIGILENHLIENSKIIQNNRPDKFSQLRENFKNLIDKMKEEKNDKFANKYYDTLKYIYMKEIEKIEVESYRAFILGELMKEKDIIKKSNDILQILLNDCFDDFIYTQEDLLEGEYTIIRLIDEYLKDNKKDYIFALTNTLLYFFEKNSLIYLKDQSLEGEPLDVFEECNKFLSDLNENNIELHGKNIHITKLFCIGYIKSYCFIFIKNHELSDFEPDNIIKKINALGEREIIEIYIYKLIYNQNKKQINIFFNDSITNKYKLNNYTGFEDFIKFKNEEFSFYDKYDNNDNYKKIFEKLKEYKKESFKNVISDEDINEIKEFNFDDFYFAAYNLILSKLNDKDFLEDDIYTNFYNNICQPLYKNSDEDKLLILLEFLFDKKKYLQIKEAYQINPDDIKAILFGYRYCLNEISEKYEDKNDYIYAVLYDNNENLNYIHKYFYPGSDIKEEEPYYELYNKIENHFKEKPNQGCYICLCNKGYYHSVPFGFPGYSETNIKCPNCGKEIGAKEKFVEQKYENRNTIKLLKIYETINRAKYFRIFNNKEEINKVERNKYKYNKLKEIENNYMTKDEFKRKYIQPLYDKEKGLNKISENYFKKDNKNIRNLSQLSYRLLNYILYSHLFFAKLLTGKEKLDDYKPKNMTWFDTIKECFILLENELEKKGIKEIEIFMNFIFKDLFNKLHDKECINKYEDLIKFEEEIEILIQEKLELAKKEIDKFKNFEKESIKDKNSGIALLKEIYNKNEYKVKILSYYEYFYYSDYIDEKYINNILEHKNKNEYPLLSQYLQTSKQKKVEDLYSLDKLIIFNKVLNLFYDEYNNQITREKAEKTLIKDSSIYKKALEKQQEEQEEKNFEKMNKNKSENDKEKEDKNDFEKEKNNNKKKGKKKTKDLNNKELIEKFIDIYNKFEFECKNENGESEKMKLDINKNYICDLILVNDNKYGKTYRLIYQTFIEKQNKELEDLLDKKINLGLFNNNCKNSVSAQQIKENEVFTFNIPKKKFDFIDVIFNSSYRKVIDTQNYEDYNKYEINLDLTEIKMTDLLLKNKKLLNQELIQFNYNNEVFSNEIKDLISNFKYGDMNVVLSINDKVIFYNFMVNNNGNNYKYILIIKDFITLIEYINKAKVNGNINENTKISDIEIVKNKLNISEDFQTFFVDKNELNKKDKNDNQSQKGDLIVNKIPKLFDYYLKIIFKHIKLNIEKYQTKNEEGNEIKKTTEKTNDNNNIKENQKFVLDEDIIKKLDIIFKRDNFLIKKESLATAIRLFISLVLYMEEEKDKDKKIKSNRKNVIDYLNQKDLWDINIYNDKRFKDDLEKIKALNIKIKEIISFYYYLIDNKEERFEEEVKEHLEKLKEEEIKKKKEKEKLENEERNQKTGELQVKKRPRITKNKKKRKNSDSDSD